MLKNYSIFLIVFLSCYSFAQRDGEFLLKEGDLIFQDLDCGPLCDAIENVTEGYNNSDFSHIGLVVFDSTGYPEILEAVSGGVQITPVEKFLNRSFDQNGNPKAVVGRLKKEFRDKIPVLINEAKSYLNKPYDNIYLIDNNSYYCSELIYLAALKANDNEEFFKLNPMTFKDPDSGNFNKAWINHFNKLGEEIPEGKPGINPGGISLSDKIEIVHVYGYPDGWSNKSKF